MVENETTEDSGIRCKGCLRYHPPYRNPITGDLFDNPTWGACEAGAHLGRWSDGGVGPRKNSPLPCPGPIYGEVPEVKSPIAKPVAAKQRREKT